MLGLALWKELNKKKGFCLSVKNYYKVVLFIPEVGRNVGTTEGILVGNNVGTIVGGFVGTTVGTRVG